jgi:hypothetical protein
MYYKYLIINKLTPRKTTFETPQKHGKHGVSQNRKI